MKILVIGSRGFIGSHCVEYFKSKAHEVWGCDVVVDYNDPYYIWIESIDDDFIELFSLNKFDVCINCSGAASVPFSIEKPYNDFKLNTINVIKILEAIRVYNKDCKFLTMSSAAVYGNPECLPVKTSSANSPVSPYGYHKMLSEIICKEYNSLWGVKTCCARIFSAYGPGLKKQLFWDIYKKIKQNEVVELWGTGKESRDFIYITDLVKAIDLIIVNSSFAGNVINVANGQQVFIDDVVNTFSKIIKSNKSIVFSGKVKAGDPINWEADITELKTWGYSPEIDIEVGIKQYIQWVEKE